MSAEVRNLQVVGYNVGVFSGFQVCGFHYKGDDGKLAWQVDVWALAGGPLHIYWVERDEFLEVGVHIGYDLTRNTLIQTFGPADVPSEEKQAILEALKKWETDAP